MKYSEINSIKELRKLYSFNQAHMAYFLGISLRNYRNKEEGKEPFTQFEMIKLSLIFDLESDDIYRLFFSEENNLLLYLQNNLHHFDRKAFFNDFKKMINENTTLFTPWNYYNKKKEKKKENEEK